MNPDSKAKMMFPDSPLLEPSMRAQSEYEVIRRVLDVKLVREGDDSVDWIASLIYWQLEEYKKIKVSDLKTYKHNNKKHGENVVKIVESMQAN